MNIREEIIQVNKTVIFNDELFPLSLPGYGHLSSKGYFEISETINKHLYHQSLKSSQYFAKYQYLIIDHPKNQH